MKKILIVLLSCLLLTGCGGSAAVSEEIELPEGVSLIADHIGVTITDPSEREDPMVTFYGYSEQTAENIYAYLYLSGKIIEMQVDYCEITCCLPNRTPLSYHMPDNIEGIILPQVWVDYAEEKGIYDGTAELEDFVDADKIENITRNIDNILEEQLSAYCEEEETESTESGEKAEVIKSQDYDLGDGETMSFILTENDGVRTLEVYAKIADVDKASMAVDTVLVGIAGQNGYENWNYGIVCGDNMAVGSNEIVLVSYVDGERGEWLVDSENYTLSLDELLDYHFMILDFFEDFVGEE